jgi:4-hydroxybenzoate polyprenyltransferase
MSQVMSQARAMIRLMRPHQWVKNGFVFVGLLFGHAWRDPVLTQAAVLAFVAFCLMSSGVYICNDFIDREQDRHHPDKRHRPLASGAVSTHAALMLAMACLGGALLLALVASQAPWLFLIYLAMQVAYNTGAKHIVVLDVFIIAAGFMLRILAGTVGIGIPPTHWLLLCSLMLTLFLGFAKRRAELEVMVDDSAIHRRVLEHYSRPLLDQFIVIAATGTVVSYALYTVSPETMALHGTRWLIATLPFVLYGLLRYLYLLHRQGGGGDPAREVLTDPHLQVSLAGWALLMVGLLSF